MKSAAAVRQAVGYDAGKLVLGHKHFLTVDTLGSVLRVLVTAANIGEREGGKQVRIAGQKHGQCRVAPEYSLG